MIDSVPKQNNEKTEEVFRCVKGLIGEVPDLEIPEAVINRHIELVLIIPTKRRKCLSQLLLALQPLAIVQHFTELEVLQETAQVRLDPTKWQYDILKARNKYIKSIGHAAKFCYADINCRMKIKWTDISEDFF